MKVWLATRRAALTALAAVVLSSSLAGAEPVLIQSTTSTQNSGLFDHILPLFEADTGITVRVVAVGTGQALRNARNGDGDVVLVHARSAEEAFVDAGYGVERHDVMYNDYQRIRPRLAGVQAPSRHSTRSRVVSTSLSRAAMTVAHIRPSCGCGPTRPTIQQTFRARGIGKRARAWEPA